MSRYLRNELYKQVIQDAREFTDNDFPGFTTYRGNSSSDKVYPGQFNFQTSLLLQLAEKIKSLEERIEQITTLPNRPSNELVIKKETWKFW